MAVSYTLVQNKNEKSAYNGQYYAKAKITGTCSMETFSERIQRNCSMKKSDVSAVLIELIEVLKDELQAGHKVTIDGLGSFQIGIKGSYAETEEAFNVGTNIASYRVNFAPEYTFVKTGTAVNSKGETYATRAKVASLTEGITVKQY